MNDVVWIINGSWKIRDREWGVLWECREVLCKEEWMGRRIEKRNEVVIRGERVGVLRGFGERIEVGRKSKE